MVPFFFFGSSGSYVLLMQDQGKMLWQMGPWEVAQSHRQIIFNLRSVYGLNCHLLISWP